MSQLSALDTSQGVADHATGAGAASALAARAKFKQVVGPYVAFEIRDGSSTIWLYAGPVRPGCACGRRDCAVDKLAADRAALEDVPGQEADLQLFLAYWAYRITHRACMGDGHEVDVVLN